MSQSEDALYKGIDDKVVIKEKLLITPRSYVFVSEERGGLGDLGFEDQKNATIK